MSLVSKIASLFDQNVQKLFIQKSPFRALFLNKEAPLLGIQFICFLKRLVVWRRLEMCIILFILWQTPFYGSYWPLVELSLRYSSLNLKEYCDIFLEEFLSYFEVLIGSLIQPKFTINPIQYFISKSFFKERTRYDDFRK